MYFDLNARNGPPPVASNSIASKRNIMPGKPKESTNSQPAKPKSATTVVPKSDTPPIRRPPSGNTFVRVSPTVRGKRAPQLLAHSTRANPLA